MLERKILILLYSLALALSASAESYRFGNKESRVGFEIKHLGGVARGQFKDFRGTLQFFPDAPERSRVELTAKVKSIDTTSAKRDAHLRRDDFFDAAKYPNLTFKSKLFVKVGKVYKVTGPLTIRGVTKNITLRVRLAKRQVLWASGAEALDFRANYELNRHDFGVSGSSSLINEEVRIFLNIRAIEEP